MATRNSIPLAPDFSNPVISGSYPDPSILRVGDDYYLVHSSFCYFPGVPIFHSKDLVHWRQIGYVLDREEQLDLKYRRSNGGIYAPTLRYHDGIFYMITTHVDGIGNFFVTATDPAGPWSNPVIVEDNGIDPSLFFDDDGKVYYTQHVGGGDGYVGQAEIDIKTGKLKGPLRNIWAGSGSIWPEGPHLYKVDGKYYLLIAEGGTSYGHMITIARSDSPMGPFEGNPGNPILTHKDDNRHPFQSIGHADFVETPAGWWLVCLGVRPANHHLGRETFLAPLQWVDGWPVINNGQLLKEKMAAPALEPVLWPEIPVRDDFDNSVLAVYWNYLRNPVPDDYSLSERPGYLRLYGSEITLYNQHTPTFIGRRQEHARADFATKMSFSPGAENEEAGLVIRCSDEYHLEFGLHLKEGHPHLFLRRYAKGKEDSSTGREIPQTESIILSVEAYPDIYKFYYQLPGEEPLFLGSADPLLYSYEKTGSFMGVLVGIYATGNKKRNSSPADFDWFEYKGIRK